MPKRKQRGKKSRQPPRRLKHLVSKMEEKGLLEDYEVVYEPAGKAKMSAVLIDFIDPYAEYVSVVASG